MATEDGRSFLKTGCTVLLGLLGLVAAGFAVLMVVAWIHVRGEQIITAELEREPLQPAPDAAEGAPETASPPPPGLRVLLDIKDADVTVAPGTSLRVDASFDARYFELKRMPSADEADALSTWHVWFRRTGGSGSLMHMMHEMFGATRPEIRVQLPPGLPLELHLNTSAGLTTAELGGLEITEVYAELSGGGLSIEVSEPSMSMERFKIDSRQSTIAVHSLGNASPANVVIDCTMGTADVDLRGNWRSDANVLLETTMARGSLWLPEDVNIEGLPGWRSPRSDELPAPTLHFDVEARAGGLRIE